MVVVAVVASCSAGRGALLSEAVLLLRLMMRLVSTWGAASMANGCLCSKRALC